MTRGNSKKRMFQRLQTWAQTRLQNEEGLTLIELMVVIVILGIIATIAIPAISAAINNSKTSATETEMSALQQAVQEYDANNGVYPLPTGSNTLVQILTSSSNGGPYLDSSTFNDGWGQAIGYDPVGTATGNYQGASVSGSTGYVLGALGSAGGTAFTSNVMPSGTKLAANQFYAAGGNLGAGATMTDTNPTELTGSNTVTAP